MCYEDKNKTGKQVIIDSHPPNIGKKVTQRKYDAEGARRREVQDDKKL